VSTVANAKGGSGGSSRVSELGSGGARLRWDAGRAEPDGRRSAEALPVFEELAEAVSLPHEAVHLAALAADSDLAEEFRVLRSKVRAIGEERPFRCIGTVSSAPGEGKTTVSLGLAAALAQEREDRRVVLVEADLRKRSMARYLGLEPNAGLSEWLQGDATLPVPLRRLGARGPFLLTAGMSNHPSPEVLASGNVARLLEACRRCFDYVVVDCPPLVPVADTVLLQDLLDGFLLVVRARHAPRQAVLRALTHLKDERIQGVVFNDYDELLRRAYSYAQRKY
jgi:capsular exopolysaccharide synthesis family protein